MNLMRFFSCSSSNNAVDQRQQQPGERVKSFVESYKVIKDLGEGGFAVVKLAQRLSDGEKVAVKISKPLRTTEADLHALREEYEILKLMNHRNIVEAYEMFDNKRDVPHTIYITLEFLAGGELFHRIVQKKQYTEMEARDTAVRILRALEHIHERDVVHRDLKPENLLLKHQDDDTALKVADFGLAKRAAGDTIVDKSGTPSYVSPEMILGTPYGKASDMWAFGVILFILIGGYPPFQGENMKSLFRKISKAKFIFHPQRWSNISEDVKDLITKLLTVNTTKRLTATDALNHPWVHASSHTLSNKSLEDTIGSLRSFNAARKLKAAVRTVIFSNRMTKIIRKDLERQKSRPLSRRQRTNSSISGSIGGSNDDLQKSHSRSPYSQKKAKEILRSNSGNATRNADGTETEETSPHPGAGGVDANQVPTDSREDNQQDRSKDLLSTEDLAIQIDDDDEDAYNSDEDDDEDDEDDGDDDDAGVGGDGAADDRDDVDLESDAALLPIIEEHLSPLTKRERSRYSMRMSSQTTFSAQSSALETQQQSRTVSGDAAATAVASTVANGAAGGDTAAANDAVAVKDADDNSKQALTTTETSTDKFITADNGAVLPSA